MRIVVNEKLCCGHAMCAAVAPDVYVLDDEGYNHMGTFTVRAGLEGQARQGALACPEFAIEVQE